MCLKCDFAVEISLVLAQQCCTIGFPIELSQKWVFTQLIYEICDEKSVTSRKLIFQFTQYCCYNGMTSASGMRSSEIIIDKVIKYDKFPRQTQFSTLQAFSPHWENKSQSQCSLNVEAKYRHWQRKEANTQWRHNFCREICRARYRYAHDFMSSLPLKSTLQPPNHLPIS